MNIKRAVALGLCAVCIFSFASCGKKPQHGNSKPMTGPSATLATSAPTFSENLSSVLEKIDIESVLENNGIQLYGDPAQLGAVSMSAQSLMNMGFETDADMAASLRPGETSPGITLTNGETELEVSIVNPYDTAVAMANGVIAGCTVASADAFGGFSFGEATQTQIMETLGRPYELSEDSLVYKIFGGKVWELGSFGDLYTGFSADSIRNWELIFGLAGGVLSSVTLIDPSLFNCGLAENVAPEELETMPYEEQTEIVEIRSTILENLTAAFADAGIEVAVDSVTGEIVLSDGVLFGNESYELSSEGKAYLDKVFGVYAETLLGGEYADKVSAIVIEGHTNTLGEFEYNQDLSEKRADAVLTHCLESEANGLSSELRSQVESLAQTVGRSYTDPVYTSDGEVDMEASRRVCLKFRISAE